MCRRGSIQNVAAEESMPADPLGGSVVGTHNVALNRLAAHFDSFTLEPLRPDEIFFQSFDLTNPVLQAMQSHFGFRPAACTVEHRPRYARSDELPRVWRRPPERLPVGDDNG